jgi:hypothetical protein
MKFMLFIEKNILRRTQKYASRKTHGYNITASNAKVLCQKRRKRSLEKTLHEVLHEVM